MEDSATSCSAKWNIAKRDGLVDTCSKRTVSRWEENQVVVAATALVSRSGGGVGIVGVGVAEKKVFAVITVWGLVLEGLRNGAAGPDGGAGAGDCEWGRRSYIRMRGPETWVHSLTRQCPT